MDHATLEEYLAAIAIRLDTHIGRDKPKIKLMGE
jgi:hypothetical protein